MDLIEALEERKIKFYKNSSKAGEITICCPECGDNRFRLGINVITGEMHCFNDGCDVRSRDLDFTFRWLAEKLETGELEASSGTVKSTSKPTETQLPEGYRRLHSNMKNKWGAKAYDYVIGRGITDRQIEKHRIGYTVVGLYKYRIIIPIWYNKKVFGFVGRDFTGYREPPYKNSVGDKMLFNLPVKKHRSIRAVLLEGIIDTLAVERALKEEECDVLGVLGSNLSPYQIKQLKTYEEVVFWSDPDKGGIQGFLRSSHKLGKKKLRMIVPDLEDTRDPDELTPKEIQQAYKQRQKLDESLELELEAKLAFQE